MLAVMTQRCELHGPPAYYTQDWDRSRDSVRRLSALAPALLVPGHGQPWGGDEMRRRLSALAEHFDDMERPRFGRYTRQPAVADETGIVMLPRDPLPAYLAGVGAMAAAAALVWAASRTPNRTPNLQPKNPNRRT